MSEIDNVPKAPAPELQAPEGAPPKPPAPEPYQAPPWLEGFCRALVNLAGPFPGQKDKVEIEIRSINGTNAPGVVLVLKPQCPRGFTLNLEGLRAAFDWVIGFKWDVSETFTQVKVKGNVAGFAVDVVVQPLWVAAFPPLSPELRGRIAKLAETLAEVVPDPLEKWELDVQRDQRDADPEHAVSVWEKLAGQYRDLTEGQSLGLDQKKGVFAVVFAFANGGPAIAREVKPRALSPERVLEIIKWLAERYRQAQP